MTGKRVVNINVFQTNCLRRLLNTVHDNGETVETFEANIGILEDWIEIHSVPSGAGYWINKDSAQLDLGIVDGRFEWQDYENDLDALTNAFIAEVDKRLKDLER